MRSAWSSSGTALPFWPSTKWISIRQEDALPTVESYLAPTHPSKKSSPISAAKGTNLDVLLQAILQRLPLGPPLLPEGRR